MFRRSRIKGVANIPQRRKIEAPNEDIAIVQPKTVTPKESFKRTALTHNVIGSDGEYSESGLTKTGNRTRIKAVPRFSNCRLSVSLQHGSASESENDSKRPNQRVRTESTSTAPPVNEPDTSPQKYIEFSSVVQKKCKRSERSRKMTEAKREFNSKFGENIPDKQKLTMMDLIFFNPINNSMAKKLKKPKKTKDEDQEPAVVVSEKEEETEIPAPRFKIGADGEIVIDKQSLVIENASLKRGREELEKAEVVDGDLETTYGIYKRHKRTKDWTNDETFLPSFKYARNRFRSDD